MKATKSEILNIVWDEYDRLLLLKNKYEGTPNGYKYAHQFMAIRNLTNRIKEKSIIKSTKK